MTEGLNLPPPVTLMTLCLCVFSTAKCYYMEIPVLSALSFPAYISPAPVSPEFVVTRGHSCVLLDTIIVFRQRRCENITVDLFIDCFICQITYTFFMQDFVVILSLQM